jgi:broad specificity phosphatase PhoE
MSSILSQLFHKASVKGASVKGPHLSLPKRIIFIRHGESMGNVDERAYSETPDWKICMTKRGFKQAENAGKTLAELCRGEKIFVYVSPYLRTMQTWQQIKSVMEAESPPPTEIIGWRQEPRVSEQQFGNFQVSLATNYF